MSRTIKDQPYFVQIMDSLGVKPNRDDWNDYDYNVPNSIWYTVGWDGHGVVGSYAKAANRQYRQRCRQAMRNGIYEFDRPRRHARWDAS